MGQSRPDAEILTRTRRPWPLVVRRARPEDRDAVVGFSTKTWNDWDYIPQAWPRWLEEQDGVMLVGTVGENAGNEPARDVNDDPIEAGRPVAIVRVAMTDPTEAWLEGIRVDPRVRGLDIATDLQVAELHWAAAQGAKIVRYATGARNEGSHRLGARGGFELLVTMRSTWWSATGDADSGDHEESGFLPNVQAEATQRRRAVLSAAAAEGLVAPASEADALWQRLAEDATFGAGARLYEPRPWALEELTRSKFIEHARRGEVLADQSGRFCLAILVGDQPPAEDSALRLAVLAGEPVAAFELLESTRRLAAESVKFRYAEDAPLLAGVEQLYRDAGYVFADWTLHILARPLDAEHPAPAIDPGAVVLEDPPEPSIVPPR